MFSRSFMRKSAGRGLVLQPISYLWIRMFTTSSTQWHKCKSGNIQFQIAKIPMELKPKYILYMMFLAFIQDFFRSTGCFQFILGRWSLLEFQPNGASYRLNHYPPSHLTLILTMNATVIITESPKLWCQGSFALLHRVLNCHDWSSS